MKTIITSFRRLAKDPGKSLLTIGTISLGIAVLILALSMSRFFADALEALLHKEGFIVAVGNGSFGLDGSYETARPAAFDNKLIPALESDVPGLEAVAPIMNIGWQYVIVNNDTYTPRSMTASTEKYADVFNLELVAGSNFTAADVQNGKTVAIISTDLADLWFGSPEAAVGKALRPSIGGIQQRGGERAERFTLPSFTVVGVYQAPLETLRKAYGIADLVIPNQSFLPAGQGGVRQLITRFTSSLVYARIRVSSIASVESYLRATISGLYGDDVEMTVWEGKADSRTTVIDDVKTAINTFSIITNILGFVLLFSGSIGILSIMLVDVLSRGREIALERAVGASKADIVKEYIARSLMISGLSLGLGIIISFFLSGPILNLLLPVFAIFPATVVKSQLVSLQAVVIAGVSALGIGALLGILPIATALKVEIIEGLREV